MNAKMNSGPLSYQIRTDISSTTAKVIIPKVHASSPKLLLYCILGAIHTDSELLVTKLFKKFFSKLLSHKNQSTDLHCKPIDWFLYGTNFY